MENLKYFHSTESLPLESDEKNYWFKRKCSIQFTINKTHQNSVDSHWGIYQFVTILAEVDQTRDNHFCLPLLFLVHSVSVKNVTASYK